MNADFSTTRRDRVQENPFHLPPSDEPLFEFCPVTLSCEDVSVVYQLFQEANDYLLNGSTEYDLARIQVVNTEMSSRLQAEFIMPSEGSSLVKGLGDDYRFYRRGQVSQPILGYLDYKSEYPSSEDVTINVFLIPRAIRALGIEQTLWTEIEKKFKNLGAKRILASVYWGHRETQLFWQGLGFQGDTAESVWLVKHVNDEHDPAKTL